MSRSACRRGHPLTAPGSIAANGECAVCRRAANNRAVRKYQATEKGRANHRACLARYQSTDKYRAVRKTPDARYEASVRGQLRAARFLVRRKIARKTEYIAMLEVALHADP